jgi:hypothetical protein
MPEKEKKHKNEELIGCTVLFKTDDGKIGSATITSVSPSKKFLHAGDANLWIDPEQIVETINDPNAPPPEPAEKEKYQEPIGQEVKSATGKAPTKDTKKK